MFGDVIVVSSWYSTAVCVLCLTPVSMRARCGVWECNLRPGQLNAAAAWTVADSGIICWRPRLEECVDENNTACPTGCGSILHCAPRLMDRARANTRCVAIHRQTEPCGRPVPAAYYGHQQAGCLHCLATAVHSFSPSIVP